MMAVFFLPLGSLPPESILARTSGLPGLSIPPTATWSLALTSTPDFLLSVAMARTVRRAAGRQQGAITFGCGRLAWASRAPSLAELPRNTDDIWAILRRQGLQLCEASSTMSQTTDVIFRSRR